MTLLVLEFGKNAPRDLVGWLSGWDVYCFHFIGSVDDKDNVHIILPFEDLKRQEMKTEQPKHISLTASYKLLISYQELIKLIEHDYYT